MHFFSWKWYFPKLFPIFHKLRRCNYCAITVDQVMFRNLLFDGIFFLNYYYFYYFLFCLSPVAPYWACSVQALKRPGNSSFPQYASDSSFWTRKVDSSERTLMSSSSSCLFAVFWVQLSGSRDIIWGCKFYLVSLKKCIRHKQENKM